MKRVIPWLLITAIMATVPAQIIIDEPVGDGPDNEYPQEMSVVTEDGDEVMVLEDAEEIEVISWVLYHHRERKNDKNRFNMEEDSFREPVDGSHVDMDAHANNGPGKTGGTGSDRSGMAALRFAVWCVGPFVFGFAGYYCWVEAMSRNRLCDSGKAVANTVSDEPQTINVSRRVVL